VACGYFFTQWDVPDDFDPPVAARYIFPGGVEREVPRDPLLDQLWTSQRFGQSF